MSPALALLVAFLKILLSGQVLMAFVEYTTHRWMLHRNTFVRLFPRAEAFRQVLKDHSADHHGRFFKCFNHEDDPQGKWVGLFFPLGYYQILWIFVAFPLLFIDWQVAVSFAGWAYIHYRLWNYFHKAMHFDEPSNPVLRLWFRYVEYNHFLHHQHRNKNFAGLLPPLMDVIFFTRAVATAEDCMVWKMIKSGQVVNRKGRVIHPRSDTGERDQT